MVILKRHWFVLLAAVYGGIMGAMGYTLVTAPFWIGLCGMSLAYVGAARKVAR